jgi:hypothetical protein
MKLDFLEKLAEALRRERMDGYEARRSDRFREALEVRKVGMSRRMARDEWDAVASEKA